MSQQEETTLQKFERIWGKEMLMTRDWQECMKKWREDLTLDTRLSILHYGFHYPATSGIHTAPTWEEGARDRINFYLDLADGWQDSLRHLNEGHCTIDTCAGWFNSLGELRRHIVRLAFKTLCYDVFKDNRKERDGAPPDWLEMINDPAILRKLIWFFRIGPMGERWSGHLVNLPREDASKDEDVRIAREFAYQLCRMAWATHENIVGVDHRSDLKNIQALKAEFIPILFGLSKLDILLAKDFGGEGATNVDFRSLLALRRLTTGFQHYLPPLEGTSHVFRYPVSLDEACYAGNQAARVWIQLRSIRRARRHLEKIEELARRQQKLDYEAATLAGKRAAVRPR